MHTQNYNFRSFEPEVAEVKKEKKVSKKAKAAIEKLEAAAKDIAHKDWDVSQDDIHFCVNMLDKYNNVNIYYFSMKIPPLTNSALPAFSQILRLI